MRRRQALQQHRPIQLAVEPRQDQRGERAQAGGFGRRGDAEEDQPGDDEDDGGKREHVDDRVAQLLPERQLCSTT